MLEDLFKVHGFSKIDNTDIVSVYKHSSSQFYFVGEYEEADFLNYEESALTESIINLYFGYQEHNPAITKNSALVILLKSNSHSLSEELLNKIYAVEEDPFGMRKYVIVAEGAILEELKKVSYDDLTQIIFNKARFDKYQENAVSNEDYEYRAAIQIFIKLPFLKMLENKDRLQTITELIDTLMTKNSYDHLKNQSIGIAGEIFSDREDFLSKAISLEKNDLDDWLDRTLGVKK
ncbi:hypothetical protein I8H83_03310 [Candidatus Saccharibacteria bacterium]|nr:hypothetical protein [Candidatus Saccharibacteria bacterium]